MCGRFTITWEAQELQEELNLGEMPADWQPRFNVAPTQRVAVVRDSTLRKVEWFRWGLIPFWAKDPAIGNQLINARSETIAEKPSFKSAFARRRCLILADGFFEWKKLTDAKSPRIPYYFHLADRKPFMLAGLWDTWKPPEGEVVQSCTIITCSPNELLAQVHDRMPVILNGDSMWKWLQGSNPEELHALLRPFPPELMSSYPVSRFVNSPDKDVRECILPVGG
jgi:putative SOS response-associated peptidase YedK